MKEKSWKALGQLVIKKGGREGSHCFFCEKASDYSCSSHCPLCLNNREYGCYNINGGKRDLGDISDDQRLAIAKLALKRITDFEDIKGMQKIIRKCYDEVVKNDV